MSPSDPILMSAYKKESELEVWKRRADGKHAHLKSYPVCRWSGQLDGPQAAGFRRLEADARSDGAAPERRAQGEGAGRQDAGSTGGVMVDRITFTILLAIIVLAMPFEAAIGWAFPPR